MASSVLFPKAATKRRLPFGSMEKWSKRPLTPGSGMVWVSFKGSAAIQMQSADCKMQNENRKPPLPIPLLFRARHVLFFVVVIIVAVAFCAFQFGVFFELGGVRNLCFGAVGEVVKEGRA